MQHLLSGPQYTEVAASGPTVLNLLSYPASENIAHDQKTELAMGDKNGFTNHHKGDLRKR